MGFMYLDFPDIKELHIEISSKCNAACPMCARNLFGGKQHPGLIPREWDSAWLPKIFHPGFTGLEHVLFCGCFGDPAAASNALEIAEYVLANTRASLEFVSNGSLRDESWWFQLGQAFRASRRGLGVFSIDGLGDTNHLYRRNTNFQKVVANARSFIAAGARARWDFIVFRHNEHQIEAAQAMAKELGFEKFRIRKTSRFYQSPNGPERFPVHNASGELEYYLEPTSRSAFRNQEVEKYAAISSSQDARESYFNSTNITCLYKHTFRRLYVNAEARAFPCCYLGNDYEGLTKSLHKDFQTKMLSRYEPNFNSLPELGWEKILTHPFFNGELEASWQSKITETRLRRCARTCGDGFSPILSQSSTSELRV